MNRTSLKFDNVTFIYESSSEAVFRGASVQIGRGWTGVVGANGAGKTTLLKLASRLLQPNDGRIIGPKHCVYCAQRTDEIPDKMRELVLANSKTAHAIRGCLGIGDDWIKRWLTLSHGERKRAQLAVALWLEPILLAIDEPTNHLDAEAREIVTSALKSFNGIGLLVSHDRELLDSLCRRCLFIEPPEVIVRRGGITKATEAAKIERKTVRRLKKQKKDVYARLQKEALKRRELASRSDKRRSKRTLAKKDSDGREKRDRARVSSKDATAGKLRRQLTGRLEKARRDKEGTVVKKEYVLGIWLDGSVSKRNFLLNLAAGSLSLGEHKRLYHPDLLIGRTDRIAITGPNGSGKSTLIRRVVKSLNVLSEHVTYVPQEIDLRRSQSILTEVAALPDNKLGHLMKIVSRLGSRPERLLNSDEPSPGETRKLLLAIGMTYTPHIVIMDEPTNHMDLPSIECIERALKDCPCSLLLVSHDKYFLSKLTSKKWNIAPDMNSCGRYVLSTV